MRVLISLIFVLFIGLLSCNKDSEEIDFGYSYFGWEEGTFVKYLVTEVFHDVALSPARDTTKYILKTLVGEDIIDNQGRTAKKFFRFRYHPETNELLDQRVWTSIIDGPRGELVEENQRIIRLVFAVRQGKTWDINVFNTEDNETARYEIVGVPRTLNGIFLDSTVTVAFEDFTSLVDFRKKRDIYAKDVGLVYRSYKDLRISNFDTLDIQRGTEILYELIEYGKE